MERVATRSRDIAVIGYDCGTSTLELTFRSGGVYHYKQVPSEVYEELLKAESKGTFFKNEISEKYSHEKVS